MLFSDIASVIFHGIVAINVTLYVDIVVDLLLSINL